MVERKRLPDEGSERLGKDGRRIGRRGGRMPGGGRRFGSVGEVKRVARAQARLTGTGKLPDELLREWADTGYMTYERANGRRTRVELDPADRISCAKGCASYYKATYQSRPAPGEQPPVVRLELDETMVAALAAKAPDKLEVLRDVLKVLAVGGADPTALAAAMTPAPAEADASRYARMLSATSDVAGRA